jgi:hypothetical protein
MKIILCFAVAWFTFLNSSHGQSPETAEPQPSPQATVQTAPSGTDSSDLEQTRADLQRLKVLVNQMRNNLAFVQTSQTPLKHQFELEADAWQVIVEQMNRRLKQMEERHTQGSH